MEDAKRELREKQKQSLVMMFTGVALTFLGVFILGRAVGPVVGILALLLMVVGCIVSLSGLVMIAMFVMRTRA
jgi:hypothetical protein